MAKSNRSKRRKESKRIEEVISDESSLMDKFYIVGGVVLFILCFYILTVYIGSWLIVNLYPPSVQVNGE